MFVHLHSFKGVKCFSHPSVQIKVFIFYFYLTFILLLFYFFIVLKNDTTQTSKVSKHFDTKMTI